MPDLGRSILLEYRGQPKGKRFPFYQMVSCCTTIHYLIYIQKTLTLVNYNLNLKKGADQYEHITFGTILVDTSDIGIIPLTSLPAQV